MLSVQDLVIARRAIDYTCCNPRSGSDGAVFDSLSDKVALAATVDAEERKRALHSRTLRSHDFAYEAFTLVPFAFESSGAWSASGLKLWKELKAIYRKSGQPNYVVQEVEHTWSAFTFQQMIPQKLSFDVHYWSARASIRAIRRSADMAARARDC